MTETFSQLFEQSESQNLAPNSGEKIKAVVVAFQKGFVIVDAGLKSEAAIPAQEFTNGAGELEVELGEVVDVVVDQLENGSGETKLSREKAKLIETWNRLQAIHDEKTTIIGLVTGKVKGGFTVEFDGVRAFLPGSLVDIRPGREHTQLENKEFEFKVIKLDKKQNNIVVSRRAVIETESSAEREKILANIAEGDIVKGIVKNLTDYGSFIDLGGIDGLLHITDIAWKRVRHPSEVLTIGDEIEVKVLSFDKERSRLSLGLKQLQDNPWDVVFEKYNVGDRVVGKVSNLTEYGCFVEIMKGIEGLVHISEFDWTSKNHHPSKYVNIGDDVEVQILNIDKELRRISLGIKQCKENPWKAFDAKYNKGDKITGKVKSITEFGIFIGLDFDIDGLIHISDISLNGQSDEVLQKFKKGDEVQAVVSQIDAAKERVSLSIKLLEEDHLTTFASQFKRNDAIKAVVKEVTEKGATFTLANNIEAYAKAQDISDKGVNPAEVLAPAQEVEVFFLGVKNKSINVSLRPKAEEKEKVQQQDVKSTAFADAFKSAQSN